MARDLTVFRDEDIVLSDREYARIKASLSRAAGKARTRIVAGLIMQGLTTAQLAAIQGRPEEEVRLECQESISAVADQLESMPEGPMILAQTCLEGYGFFMTRVMRATEECLMQAQAGGNAKDWTAASSMLRLSKETMDTHIEWMQKLGMLPNFTRPVGRPKKDVDPEVKMRELATQAGTTVEEIESAIVASAVAPKPMAPEVED